MEKLFARNKHNNIIMIKYKLLNKDYKREKLFMRETKDVVLNEVMKELNFIEKIFFKRKFIKVYKKGITYGFNIK